MLFNASLASADDPSMLEHEAIIEAPIEKVWEVFATSEGYQKLGVAKANVDLRVGGKIQSHHDPSGTLGDANTIENTILAFEPLRMLAIRVAKAPVSFPFPNAIGNMWSVITLDPLSAFQTRVTIAGMGFGTDEESQKMRAFFDQGNAQTLQNLKSSLANEAAKSDDAGVMRLMRSMVGAWAFENVTPSGKKFAGQLNVREIMDGAFILVETNLGFDGKLKPHGFMLYGKDPTTGSTYCWDFGEKGTLSGGRVRLVDGNRLLYEWKAHQPGQPQKHYFVEEVLEDSDSLRFTVYQIKPGQPKGEKPAGDALVSVLWKRQASASESGSQTSRPGFGDVARARFADADASSNADSAAARNAVEVETVVAAPIADVWHGWTTAEGARRFFAPNARIELRIGGPYELLFRTEAPAGQQGSEGCEILSYLPQQMLSFSWSAPPELGDLRRQRSYVVVQFTDLGKAGTKVKLTHRGFGEGEGWDNVRAYFSKAWPIVMQRMKEGFEKGPLDWEQIGRERETRANG